MAVANAKAQPLTNGKLKLMICDDSNIIRRKIERELQSIGVARRVDRQRTCERCSSLQLVPLKQLRARQLK